MSNPTPDDDPTPTEPLMTQAEMAKTLRALHKALVGDPLSPNREKRGIVPMFRELHADYYGDGVHPGTRDLVQKLWELRIKVIGGCVVLSAVISFLAWTIEKWVISKH